MKCLAPFSSFFTYLPCMYLLSTYLNCGFQKRPLQQFPKLLKTMDVCMRRIGSLRMTAVTSLIKSQPTQNKQTQLMQNLQPYDGAEDTYIQLIEKKILLRNAYLVCVTSYSLINYNVKSNQKTYMLTMLKRRIRGHSITTWTR